MRRDERKLDVGNEQEERPAGYEPPAAETVGAAEALTLGSATHGPLDNENNPDRSWIYSKGPKPEESEPESQPEPKPE